MGQSSCGDYRRLNTETVQDRYPLSNIADFTSHLNGCKNFTQLDLTKGYYQVSISKGDIPKTVVITPFGLFEWIQMPFGLRNAGCTFQRMMDQILGDIPHCFIYIDNILIASPDAESHQSHVCQIFDCLQLHRLSINPDKCVFASQEVDYLGMRVTSKGLFPWKNILKLYPHSLHLWTRKVSNVCSGFLISIRDLSKELLDYFLP